MSYHNVSAMMDGGVWGLVDAINQSSSYFFAYGVLLIVFIVAAYVTIKGTSDIEKGMIISLYITVVTSLFLYFGGKAFGSTFIPDIVELLFVVALSIAVAVLHFTRMERV